MIPRIATVLSARDWESRLVAHARETAAVRLVLRAYRPADVEGRTGDLDAVVAGAETSWVTPARIGAWRRSGIRVVGIHPAGDRPARDRLVAAGADDVLADDTPSEGITRAVRLLDPPAAPTGPPRGRVTAVVGPRGAPGRTEIAFGLATAFSDTHDTLLVDLDLEAPALAVRLGLAPRPDVLDASDGVHATGTLEDTALRGRNRLSVLVASHRPDQPGLRPEAADDLLTAAAARFERVVVDAGITSDPVGADDVVLVADASPTGIVRAAHMTDAWTGPRPTLVLNRVPREDAADVVTAVRRWTGLDPAAVVLDDARIRDRARRAGPPARSLARMAERMAVSA
ncbi:MAG: hypothetical protein R3290_03490 [Acidimicrobiia bacterium]|nr:hypothetical protein [Acidimicrobiia bacterium]